MDKQPWCTFHNIPCEFKEGVNPKGESYAFWGCPSPQVDGKYCKSPHEMRDTKIEDKPKVVDWDEKGRRIERQHSQSVAVEFASLLIQTGQLLEVTLDDINGFTDHFAKDINEKLKSQE